MGTGMNPRELKYRLRLWYTRQLAPFMTWYLLPAAVLAGIIAASAIVPS